MLWVGRQICNPWKATWKYLITFRPATTLVEKLSACVQETYR